MPSKVQANKSGQSGGRDSPGSLGIPAPPLSGGTLTLLEGIIYCPIDFRHSNTSSLFKLGRKFCFGFAAALTLRSLWRVGRILVGLYTRCCALGRLESVDESLMSPRVWQFLRRIHSNQSPCSCSWLMLQSNKQYFAILRAERPFFISERRFPPYP